ISHPLLSFFFFLTDSAPTHISTLSLHDALPIFNLPFSFTHAANRGACFQPLHIGADIRVGIECNLRRHGPIKNNQSVAVNDRIRSEEHTSELQSREISYAVFCLKKKKRKKKKYK